MAKTCSCGSPMCPICKGKATGDITTTYLARGIQRQGKEPRYKFGGRTPNVPRHEPETEVVRAETVSVRPNNSGVCLECGRPYCPECGNPIPVRGDYCKPACRVKAWRKKRVE